MRNYSEGAAEKYVAIGEAIGEARGLAKGEALGEAMGIITTARDLGASDTYIIEKLMEYLGISEAEARKYIRANGPAAKGRPGVQLRALDGGKRHG